MAASEKETWLHNLREQGYCLLQGVAGTEEVTKARELLWEWLENLEKGIKRNDPSTWTKDAWPKGFKRYGSQMKEGEVHLPVNWYLRSLPSVRKVFSHIYSTCGLSSVEDCVSLIEDPASNSEVIRISQLYGPQSVWPLIRLSQAYIW